VSNAPRRQPSQPIRLGKSETAEECSSEERECFAT
jgi:hypothetical protein